MNDHLLNFTFLKKEKLSLDIRKTRSVSNLEEVVSINLLKNINKYELDIQSYILFINRIKDKNYFIFYSVNKFKKFIRLISNTLIGITYNWFINLEMQGLGFRFFYNKIENLIRLKLGYSHYIMIKCDKIPINIKSKRRLGKTSILLSCISKDFLLKLSSILTRFRPLNKYKLKGIYKKDYLVTHVLKQGKKKLLA